MAFTRNQASGEPDLGKLRLGDIPLILMYHSVQDVPCDPHGLSVTSARFCEQMAWLAKCGLRGVSVETLVAAMRRGRARGLVGITFDDGYVSVLENAVPQLLRYGFTATMFVVSGRLGGINEWDAEPVWPLMSAHQVLELAAAGMEIGSHGTTHTHLVGLEADQLSSEVGESRSKLSELLGRPIRGFAYPYGNMDASVRLAVRDAGYSYACAVETSMADLGIMALPRITLGQRDSSKRMTIRRTFFKGYTATKGTRQRIASIPLVNKARKLRLGLPADLSAICTRHAYGA